MNTITLDTVYGVKFRIVPIKEATFSTSTGKMTIMSALSYERNPYVLVLAQDKSGLWQYSLVSKPEEVQETIDAQAWRASFNNTNKDFAAMTLASAKLLQASKTGLKSLVTEVQNKVTKRINKAA